MSNLSVRGHHASIGSKDTLIWDVLHNLWDPQTNPTGFISLGVAENALMHDELVQYINKITNHPAHKLTYGDGPTGSKRLKAVISKFLTRGLKAATPVLPTHIVITSGVTAAIEHCSWAFCDPSEGILLGMPHYGAFVPDISTRPGSKVIEVAFGDVDPISSDCVSKYEDALLFAERNGTRIKALMLCNPHNPLGRCYSRSTLLSLMAFCGKRNIHLISDEIYAFTTWPNTTLSPSDPPPEPFTSILSLPPTSTTCPPHLIHALWGLSKDFGANGLRLGVIISQSNPAFLTAIRSVALHSAPSALADHVAYTLLSDTSFTDSYIKTNQRRLAESYTFITAWAEKYGIPYAKGANAAFFLWCDFGAVWRDGPHADADADAQAQSDHENDRSSLTITNQIMGALMSAKIFLASGETFGSEKEGWFRIVFSQPQDYLEQGLRRIVHALGIDAREGE